MTEETALTVKAQTEQALMAQLAELGPLAVDEKWKKRLRDEDKARLPRMRLSQQNKPIKMNDGLQTQPGDIVCIELGDVYENGTGLEMFPLREVNFTFVKWPIDYDAQNNPLCASNDGAMPDSSGRRVLDDVQPGPCTQNGADVCPSALWTGTKEERVPPRCTRQRNFVIVVLKEDGVFVPAMLTMERTSMRASQALTGLMQRLNPRRPQSIMLTSVPKDDGSKMWIEYVCGKGRALDLAQQVTVRTLQIEFDTMYAEGRIKVEFDDGLQETGDTDPHGGPAGEHPDDGGPILGMDKPALLLFDTEPTASKQPPMPELPPNF